MSGHLIKTGISPIMLYLPHPFPTSLKPCRPLLTFNLELLGLFFTSPFQGSLCHIFHKEHNLILTSSLFSLHICSQLFCRYENGRHLTWWSPCPRLALPSSPYFPTRFLNSCFFSLLHSPLLLPQFLHQKELRGWPWFLPPLWILVNSLGKRSVTQWPISESLEKSGETLSTFYHVGRVPSQLWFSCICFCSPSTSAHVSPTSSSLLILA